MTDEEKIHEMWQILDTATRLEFLKGRHSFLDYALKISEIVAWWVATAVGIAILWCIWAVFAPELLR